MLSEIQNTENYFDGDGSTVEFTLDFYVFRQADVKAFVDGVAETGFTVTNMGTTTPATITFDTAPAAGTGNVAIVLDPAATRDTDYQLNGDFLASQVNRDMDRIWQFLQVKERQDVKEIDDTSYAVTADDRGSVLRFTSNADVALDVDADIALLGFHFIVVQAGEGQITFGGDATLRNFDEHTKTAGQYAAVGFLCDTAGEFNFSGKTA